MPVYTCSECNKQFKDRTKYVIHTNRKFPCKKDDISSSNESIYDEINENVPNPDDEISNPINSISNPNKSESLSNECNTNIMCYYCLTIFSSKCNLYRHMRLNCKVKKQEDNKKEEIYQKLLKENEELKKELEKVKNENKQMKTSGKTINNPKNCNIHNGDVNNIVIVAHGKEDLDKIDVKYILEALKRGTSAIPVITERIHFNVKYPEYQNVYITNMNQKYGMIYDGKEWKLKDKDTIIDDLYEKKYDFLDENFENIYIQLSESQQKAFKRFLDIHDKADTDKQSRKIINKIKQDLKFILYNNKKIPIDNYIKITKNEEITNEKEE